MAGKCKYQISRSLDERIRKFIECNEECAPEFLDLEGVFVLGFNHANVSNYFGLTTDYKLHNATAPVLGRVYFKAAPNEQQIKADLEPCWKFFYESPDGLGSNPQSDKNEHLFLVYYKDSDSGRADKRIFDFNAGTFLAEQPSLAIIEDSKVLAHSALVKLNVCIKLELFASGNKLHDKDKLASTIEEAKQTLSSGKGFKLHLVRSNFSTPNFSTEKMPIETLYSYLSVPDEVLQMGDYLPQMTKEEKKKLATKWRNKVKDQRFPLEMELEHDDLSLSADDKAPQNFYKLKLEEYLYLQVNDTLAKGWRYILMLMRQKLEMIKVQLLERAVQELEEDEVRSCTFKPFQVNHLVPAVYLLPTKARPDFEKLRANRAVLHHSYLIPLNRPAVRYSQRILNSNLKNSDEQQGFLCNVHTDIQDKSGIKGGTRSIIGGTYTYHHYLQDRAQDNGWGCAYRSLQTIVSWFKHQAYIYSPDVELRAPPGAAASGVGDKISSLRTRLHVEARVPTHEEIQAVLVDVGDKQASFIGSQKWIGSQEVCYVLNHLYNLDSKFISVSSGNELVYKARDLGQHFLQQSTPVMIGGGVLAHTIIGLDFNEKNGDISYLILDPHYTGAEDLATITKKGWCGWKKNAFWDKNSFYNLCLPQRPVEF